MGGFDEFGLYFEEAALFLCADWFTSPDVDAGSSDLVEVDVDAVEVAGLSEQGEDLLLDFGLDSFGLGLGLGGCLGCGCCCGRPEPSR